MARNLYEQGEMRAKQELIIKLLEARFGSIPDAVIREVFATEDILRLDILFDETIAAQGFNDIPSLARHGKLWDIIETHHIHGYGLSPPVKKTMNVVYDKEPELSRKEQVERIGKTITEYHLEQGFKQGFKKGLELGRQRERLLTLLRSRFNTLPEAVVKEVSEMLDISRLDALLEEAETAERLDTLSLACFERYSQRMS